MAELKCPHCGKTFKVDDTSYADILSQVRNREFEEELHARLKDVEKQAHADRDLALAKQEATQAKKIAELEAKLKQADTDRELAVARALAPVERELESTLNNIVKQSLIVCARPHFRMHILKKTTMHALVVRVTTSIAKMTGRATR